MLSTMPPAIVAFLLLHTHVLALLIGAFLGSRYDDAIRRDPRGFRAVLVTGCLLLLVVDAVLLSRA